MSVEMNDPRLEIGDQVRTQLLGRSIAGLFWLVVILLTCASASLLTA